jgi:hypothetical protein
MNTTILATDALLERRRIAIGIGSLLTICSLLASCSKVMDYQIDSRSFSTKHFSLVETNTGLHIPPGSRGLNMYYCGSERTPSFIVKIEIAKTAREGFIKQLSNIPVGGWGADTPSIAEKVDWWTPFAGTLLIRRKFATPRPAAYVDASLSEQGGHTVLYIYWAH